MKLNKMNLETAAPASAKASKIIDFALGEERSSRVREMIKEALELEFWSPKYQAWRNLFERYLLSGNDPDLTKAVYPQIADKEDWIKVPTCFHSKLFSEILRFQNTSTKEVFRDIRYEMIYDFCDIQCRFLISQRNRILREIHAEGVCMDIMSQLLDKHTYRAFMCAVIFYRENQPFGFDFPESIQKELSNRLDTWKKEFLAEFNSIQELLGDLKEQYRWYSDVIRNALDLCWSTALQKGGRPYFISTRDSMRLPSDLVGALEGYIKSSPGGDGIILEETSVFDAIYHIFYNNILEDPDNVERCFFGLCIPKGRFSAMVDILYSFYWCVMDNKLTSMLYNSIMVSYCNGNDVPEPKSYLESLKYRGFPELR